MPPDTPETVVAYQRLRLREIRAICDQQNLEIDHYTEVEKDISKEIGSLDIEFSDVRQTLASLGVELDGRGDIRLPHRPLTPLRPESHSEKTPPSIDFEDLVAEAGLYLTETGVDPNKDPCSSSSASQRQAILTEDTEEPSERSPGISLTTSRSSWPGS